MIKEGLWMDGMGWNGIGWLGKDPATKSDDFLEKFQTAFDPPIIFKIIFQSYDHQFKNQFSKA